jgi:hypothetical protein
MKEKYFEIPIRPNNNIGIQYLSSQISVDQKQTIHRKSKIYVLSLNIILYSSHQWCFKASFSNAQRLFDWYLRDKVILPVVCYSFLFCQKILLLTWFVFFFHSLKSRPPDGRCMYKRKKKVSHQFCDPARPLIYSSMCARNRRFQYTFSCFA